jgi:glycosyltransferase involved in cell wall biosynthesis
MLFPKTFSMLRRYYYKFIIPRSVGRSAGVIADSKSTRLDIMKHLPKSKGGVTAIHLGVDPVRFYNISDEERREALRKRYDLPEKFILYVGTLEPRKNIPRLIRAFSYGVVAKGLPHHLVIAGREGWMFKSIFKEVRLHNLEERVHFPGFVEPSDLATLYSMARSLAYPSLYEGFGLPCLEAMSCGTPVVTSDSSSLPELVGDYGLKVDPTSVDALAGALHKICSDDECYHNLSVRGAERARQFSWLTTARKTVDLYNRTIAEAL